MEIIHQGAQQFMAMWEDFNCPFNERKQPVERKLWLKGWHEAKIKWFKTFERARKPFRRPNEQQANNRRMPKKAKA
jgi:ribosome modulation factor